MKNGDFVSGKKLKNNIRENNFIHKLTKKYKVNYQI